MVGRVGKRHKSVQFKPKCTSGQTGNTYYFPACLACPDNYLLRNISTLPADTIVWGRDFQFVKALTVKNRSHLFSLHQVYSNIRS